MKIIRETGIATFIQFCVVSLFALAIQVSALVSSCVHTGSQCSEDVLPNIGYFILTSLLFFGIFFLGHTAQEKRTKLITLGLLFLELGVARIAYHNAKHATDVLGLVASSANVVLSIWVILLCIRLFRSKGGRVVSRSRVRKRQKPTADL